MYSLGLVLETITTNWSAESMNILRPDWRGKKGVVPARDLKVKRIPSKMS